MQMPDFGRAHDVAVIAATETLREAVQSGEGFFGGYEVKPPSNQAEIDAARKLLGDLASAQTPEPDADVSRCTIAGPAGDIPLLLVKAKEPVAGLLHIHGGGWYAGAPELSLTTLIALAREARVTIASVDYRLAPEHPYPAAQDDCEVAALWWLAECEQQGLSKCFIAGESAGAHLSAATRLRLAARGKTFSGAILTYGLFDFSNGLPSRTVVDGQNLIQNSAMCHFYADTYLPPGADRTDPDISPLKASLRNLGPSLLTVGELDPFYDDSLLLHMRLIAEGNRSYLAIFKEAPHAFEMLDPALGEHSVAMAAEFIEACLY